VNRSVAEIEAAVRGDGLLGPGHPVLVMFSGGRDSTCLLDLAVRISGAGAVRALHVNYGLRPGAVLEERHCETACRELGVPLAIERPPGPQRAGNLQAWAREVRYGAAHQRAAGSDIAAGHTASDQLESVLYRLISSPSRRALLGMEPRAGQLIRPLLVVSRDEVTAYCNERGLAYCDDPTNDAPTYVRNRIRHELVPLLDELHPGATANVLALVNVLRAESEVLDDQVRHAIDARANVPLRELRALPHGLCALVVQHLADTALDRPAAGVARRVDDVLAMTDNAILDLPAGVRAATKGGHLRFERTPPLHR
jgi:tRNA(Ile)-lysidine synthase